MWKDKVCPVGEPAKAQPAFGPRPQWDMLLHPGLLSLGCQPQWMEDTSGLPRVMKVLTVPLFHPTVLVSGNF